MKRDHDRASRPLNRKSRRKPVKRTRRHEAPSIFPIVGIGASAGGLEAVTQLLQHLPPDTGMAFVLVQHLDPAHESALTALLARATAMPVMQASDDVPLEANHIYIIPPNKSMGISARHLKLFPRRGEGNMTVNLFFKSLAGEEGGNAVGIVLSGNGGDGTQGLLAIKAAGGITFAQEEKSAKYPTMPATAIAAGCVDFILSPEKMAYELKRFGDHLARGLPLGEIQLPTEGKAFEDIWWSVRIRPYKTLDHKIDGAVIGLFHVDSIETTSFYGGDAYKFAAAMAGISDSPIMVLNKHLEVRAVNNALCDVFKINTGDIAGHPLDELATYRWDVSGLRAFLEGPLKGSESDHGFQMELDFLPTGRAPVRLSGRRILLDDKSDEIIMLGFNEE